MAQEYLAVGVADALGSRIVNGEVGPGRALRLEDVELEFGVSRSVAREAAKILESFNLVRARRRVGLLVQAPDQWDVMAPRVIGWHLDGPHRMAEMAWISELRSAVEPLAARLAAERATVEQCHVLGAAVTGMVVSAGAHEMEDYLRHDVVFHTTLLAAARNPLVAAQGKVVTAVLEGRTALMPFDPNPQAVALHRRVADAVSAHDGAAAEQAMRAIVAEALDAMEHSAQG